MWNGKYFSLHNGFMINSTNYPKRNPTFCCRLKQLAWVTDATAATPKPGDHVQAERGDLRSADTLQPCKKPEASPFCRHAVDWTGIIQRLLIYRLLYRKNRRLQSKASSPGKDILPAAARGVILQPWEELPS